MDKIKVLRNHKSNSLLLFFAQHIFTKFLAMICSQFGFIAKLTYQSSQISISLEILIVLTIDTFLSIFILQVVIESVVHVFDNTVIIVSIQVESIFI